MTNSHWVQTFAPDCVRAFSLGFSTRWGHMWSVCGPHVVRMWSACGPHVVRMWSACGWMDGWKDGWRDGWMDCHLYFSPLLTKRDHILRVISTQDTWHMYKYCICDTWRLNSSGITFVNMLQIDGKNRLLDFRYLAICM